MPGDATALHSGTWQAKIPCYDHGQQEVIAHCTEPAGSQLHIRQAEHGVDERYHLHRYLSRQAISDRCHRSVHLPHCWLVDKLERRRWERQHKRPLLVCYIARIATPYNLRHPPILHKKYSSAKNLARLQLHNSL